MPNRFDALACDASRFITRMTVTWFMSDGKNYTLVTDVNLRGDLNGRMSGTNPMPPIEHRRAVNATNVEMHHFLLENMIEETAQLHLIEIVAPKLRIVFVSLQDRFGFLPRAVVRCHLH
jgi:hypothetical protein